MRYVCIYVKTCSPNPNTFFPICSALVITKTKSHKALKLMHFLYSY